MKYSLSIFALAAWLLTPANIFGATVTLTPVADADIHQFDPANNFGAGSSMVAGALGGAANQEVRRILLRFDLAGQIPAGAVIRSATLQMTVVKVPMGPANSTFALHRILQPWSELGVTWNSRSSGAALWDSPGANGAGDSDANESSTVAVGDLGNYVFSSTASLIADVQSWAADSGTNFGWLLVSEDESTTKTARRFATREDTVNTPTLVVSYSQPPPVIVTQPQSQTVLEGDPVTFSVVASGTPPLLYRWQFESQDIPGATNATLQLAATHTNDAGAYVVVVQNADGSTASSPAVLTVIHRAIALPEVRIVVPTNGAAIASSAELLTTIQATATNAVIQQITLFTNSVAAGTSTTNPASFSLINLNPGDYALTAQATDDHGNIGSSASVTVHVLASPRIILTSPANGAHFALPAQITLAASLQAPARVLDLQSVTFFAQGIAIGTVSSAPLQVVWNAGSPGAYILSAVAEDRVGQRQTSAPVTIQLVVPETVKPTLRIEQSPGNFAKLKASSVQLSGRAHDDTGLDYLEWRVNDNSWQQMPGTEHWSFTAPLSPGLNSIRIHAVDLAGNTSQDALQFVTYAINSPLNVTTLGDGLVRPNMNGRELELGRGYVMTAVPGAGSVFDHWDFGGRAGVGNSNAADLHFVMQSNLVVTAHFVINPFPAVAGTYRGVFMSTNDVSADSTGQFQLRLNRSGVLSGSIMTGIAHFPFTGRADLQGNAKIAVLRRTLRPVVVTLNFDVLGRTGRVQGSVTDGTWVAQLSGADGTPSAAFLKLLQGHERELVLDRDSSAAASDIGTGRILVDSRGQVSARWRMSGQPTLAVNSTVSTAGDVPIYAAADGGNSAIAGWLHFDEQQPATVTGRLRCSASGSWWSVRSIP